MIEQDGWVTVHATGVKVGHVRPLAERPAATPPSTLIGPFTITNPGLPPMVGPAVRVSDARGRTWDEFYAFGRSPRRG